MSGITAHAYFKLDRKEQVNRFFLALLLVTEFLLILEVLSIVLDSRANLNFIMAHKLVDASGFALAPAVPGIGILYVYKRAHKYEKIYFAKFFWIGIPLAFNAIIAWGSYKFNWIFHITAQNVYVRGPLFFVAPLICYLYGVIYVLVIFQNRKKLLKEERLIFGSIAIIPAFLAIFQLYYPIFLTIWNSMAIVLILIYIYILHSQIKTDPLTGLGNRAVYNEYFALFHRKSNVVLAALTIDLDDFKSINDLWGHYEGDQVLRIFARQLEEVFAGKGIPIRWGGDEFLVLINENRRDILEKHIKALTARIDAWNESSGKPYRVRFSCGMTIFDNAYQSIDDLIRQSDKLMYEEKQKRIDGDCRK